MNQSNIHKFTQIIVGKHGRFVILQLHADEGEKKTKQNPACNTQHLHLVGSHIENEQTTIIFI